jgi:hypothetical protein
MESARFWPFRTTIDGRRESSVFRYLTDPSAEFPYVYQKALSLVLAVVATRGRKGRIIGQESRQAIFALCRWRDQKTKVSVKRQKASNAHKGYAAKMRGVHASSLEIVAALTL